MGITDLGNLVSTVGVPVTLVIFYSWQGWQREGKVQDREASTQDFIRDTLTKALNETTEELARTRAALERIEDWLERHDQERTGQPNAAVPLRPDRRPPKQ